MIQRELKVNFKNFLIWTLILIGLFLLVFILYPSIINELDVETLEEMMTMFPKELLTAFNMDISSINTAYGWLKSEGFVFVLLITGCYSGIMGANILLKEENDKTVEYLHSLPVKRNDIILSKVLVGIFYITLMVLAIGLFNFVGLTISGDFNHKQFLLLSITPLFSSYVIFFICMFISTFAHKTKKMLGISIGVVMLSYFFNIIASISDTTEAFKYLSVFTLADIRNVIIDISINPLMIFLSIIISLILLILVILNYNKKDLI